MNLFRSESWGCSHADVKTLTSNSCPVYWHIMYSYQKWWFCLQRKLKEKALRDKHEEQTMTGLSLYDRTEEETMTSGSLFDKQEQETMTSKSLVNMREEQTMTSMSLGTEQVWHESFNHPSWVCGTMHHLIWLAVCLTTFLSGRPNNSPVPIYTPDLRETMRG